MDIGYGDLPYLITLDEFGVVVVRLPDGLFYLLPCAFLGSG